MSLASIFTGQAALTSLVDRIGLSSVDVEQLVITAWQWLVLSAVIAWIGVTLSEYRLLMAFRRQQHSEITPVLHLAVQRQRRQSGLWLSIIFVGVVALFWLRVSHVLLEQLNFPPDWPTLWLFTLYTPEGWLWLARGALALLACAFLAGCALSAYRRARQAGLSASLTRGERSRSRWLWEENVRRGASNATLTPGRWREAGFSGTHPTPSVDTLERGLLAERRQAQISLAIGAALLCTFLLPFPDGDGAQLPILALALRGGALFALAAWLGSSLYLPTILVPATQIIESAERLQVVATLFATIRPPVIQALVPIAFYSLFSVEERRTSFSSPPLLLSTSSGWFFLIECALVGLLLLLTCYQSCRALPRLAQAARLAAQGTVMSVLGGMDVSRSLQISQRERQALADQAERRLIRAAYGQVILGMLVVLWLVIGLFMGGPQAI